MRNPREPIQGGLLERAVDEKTIMICRRLSVVNKYRAHEAKTYGTQMLGIVSEGQGIESRVVTKRYNANGLKETSVDQQ